MSLKRYIGMFMLILAVVGCGLQNEDTGSGMVQTTLQVVPQNVNRIRFTITGPGMPDIQRNVFVQPGQTVTEQFLVPRGPQRLFKVEAFTNLDYVEYLGQRIINLDQDLVTLNINANYLMRYPLYYTVTTLPSTDNLSAYDYLTSKEVRIIQGVVPVGIIHTSEYDLLKNYIYNIGARWALFMGLTRWGWVPYRMDLTDSNLNLYALSGSSTSETPCDNTSFVIENPADPINSWGLINLVGTGVCDHTIAFRASSGPSDPLIDIGGLVTDAFGVYSFDGHLQGVIYQYSTAKGYSLLHCPATDLRPQGCSVVFPVLSSLNEHGMAVTPAGTYVLLSITDYTEINRTYHYNPQTKATPKKLAILDNTSVTKIITDGQFFYLGVGNSSSSTAEVWKVPVDGSAPPLRLISVASYSGSGPYTLFLADQRLVVGYMDNTSGNYSILSINKDGSGRVDLGYNSNNNQCNYAPVSPLYPSTESPFVFYTCFIGAAPSEGCYVRADGTGRNCTSGLKWHFEPVVYTQSLHGEPFIKTGRILGYDLNTGTLISADINNPSNQVSLGSSQGVLNNIGRITHYGGGKTMIEIIDSNSLPNAYFADFESANSLKSIPTPPPTKIFKDSP